MLLLFFSAVSVPVRTRVFLFVLNPLLEQVRARSFVVAVCFLSNFALLFYLQGFALVGWLVGWLVGCCLHGNCS